jgi:hypothetical protein
VSLYRFDCAIAAVIAAAFSAPAVSAVGKLEMETGRFVAIGTFSGRYFFTKYE